MCATCLAAVDHNIESDNLNSTYLFCTNCSFATESYCILIHSLFSSALRTLLSLSLCLSFFLSLSLEGSAQCSSQPWLNYLLAASAAEPRRLRSSRFPQQPSRPDRWPCKEHCCYARPDHGTNGLCRQECRMHSSPPDRIVGLWYANITVWTRRRQAACD